MELNNIHHEKTQCRWTSVTMNREDACVVRKIKKAIEIATVEVIGERKKVRNEE